MTFDGASKVMVFITQHNGSTRKLSSAKCRSTLLLATCCSILVFSSNGSAFDAQSSSAAFYVATNGSDNNPGTLSQPWRHISYSTSNSAVKPGDTVYIRGGIYHESIQQEISGSQGKPVTYRNYADETPIISDTGAPGKWRWQVLDQSHLRIQGITFSNCHGGAIYVRTVNTDITDIEIVNCTVEHQQKYSGVAAHAVYFTSSRSGHYLQNITVQGNSFYDVDTGTEHGGSDEVLTAAGDVRDVKIIGNSIVNATNIGIDIIGRSTIGQPERALIKGNSISGHGSAGLSATGIYLDGAGKDVIIEDNVVHDGPLGITVNLEPGASDLETRQVIVRRNVLYNNRINLKLGIGDWQYNCADLGTFRDSVAVHNTVFSDIDDATNHYFSCGESLRWKNNIYSHISSSEDLQYQFGNETVDPSTWIIDYNFFHSGGGPKHYRWEGETYDSLASFQAASGQDQNSGEGNPLFVDVSNRNFHLRADSPARNAGGPLTVTTSSGNGTTIAIDDARYFSDGFGLQAGDRIRVGNNDAVTVIHVDDVNNRITVDEPISWENGEAVNYEYTESGPDMGAYEENLMEYTIYLPLITQAHSPVARSDTLLTGDRMALLIVVLALLLSLSTFTQLKLSFWVLILAAVIGVLLAWQLLAPQTPFCGHPVGRDGSTV